MTGRSLVMLVALMFATGPTVLAADVEAKTAERIDRAREKLRIKDYKAALHAAEDALADAPGNVSAHVLAARALIELGHSEEAIGHFEDALRTEPTAKGLHYLIGSLRMLQAAGEKRADKAVSEFGKAAVEFEQELRIDPQSIEALAGRAIALSRAGQTEAAIEAHDRWIAATPDAPDAYVSLVGFLDSIGRPAEELIAVSDRVPPGAAAMRSEVDVEVGRGLLNRDESDRAIAFLTSAATAPSADPGAHALLAVAYAKAKRHAEAGAEIQRFVAAAPSLEDRRRYCGWFPESLWPNLTDLRESTTEQATGTKTAPPEILSRVPPVYPEVARRARLEGRSKILSILTEEGRVAVVCTLSSNPVFEIYAVAAVEQWRYKPATIDGKPTQVWLTLVVDFQLE